MEWIEKFQAEIKEELARIEQEWIEKRIELEKAKDEFKAVDRRRDQLHSVQDAADRLATGDTIPEAPL